MFAWRSSWKAMRSQTAQRANIESVITKPTEAMTIGIELAILSCSIKEHHCQLDWKLAVDLGLITQPFLRPL